MEVIEGAGLPILNWAVGLEAKALDQARNLAALPVAQHHIALMPDCHMGFGMPIGGVLFTVGDVVPYAVGVDIGCGVAIARTDLVWGRSLTENKLRNVMRQLKAEIPTGQESRSRPLLRSVYAMSSRLGEPFPDIPPARHWLDRALHQVGTLGSGNHFVEITRDDEDRVYAWVHSGSRQLGLRICEHYAGLARDHVDGLGVDLPDRNLAWLSTESDAGRGYLAAMDYALAWAELNRRSMLELVETALRKQAGVRDFEPLLDIHHNYAARETHFGLPGIVTRKGAVRAGRGDLVLVPGSMGTPSYIGTGLGNPDAFETCQHGAGRLLSRGAAKAAKTPEEVFEEMRAWGIQLVAGEPRGVADEAASAYKPIEEVMQAAADLVARHTRLRPLAVLKG